jgi:hypothetical protein
LQIQLVEMPVKPRFHWHIQKRALLMPGRATAAGAQLRFQQLSGQNHAILAGDDFARQQSGNDLGLACVAYANANLADVKELWGAVCEKVLVAHEHNVATAFPVNGLGWRDHGFLFSAENDPATAKCVGPQPPILVG